MGRSRISAARVETEPFRAQGSFMHTQLHSCDHPCECISIYASQCCNWTKSIRLLVKFQKVYFTATLAYSSHPFDLQQWFSYFHKWCTCTLSHTGWFWGDPHLQTLDGKQYTFNGLGEFVFSNISSGELVVQARTQLVIPTNGTQRYGRGIIADVNMQSFYSYIL